MKMLDMFYIQGFGHFFIIWSCGTWLEAIIRRCFSPQLKRQVKFIQFLMIDIDSPGTISSILCEFKTKFGNFLL